jgi:hypothetical protein
MNYIVRNILAVIIGLFIGSFLNGQIVNYSAELIPLPEGLNPNNLEDLKRAAHTLPLKNFIMPFLAHALGSLLAAFVACKLAKSHKMHMALIVGALFFMGGIAVHYMIGGPVWFIIFDLVLAYFPMALLGKRFAGEKSWLPNL